MFCHHKCYMAFVNAGTCLASIPFFNSGYTYPCSVKKEKEQPERGLEGDDNVLRHRKVSVRKDSEGSDCILHKRKIRGDVKEVAKQWKVQRRQPSHSQLPFQIPFQMRVNSNQVKLKIHFIHIKGNAGAGSWLVVIVAQSRSVELENCSKVFFLDVSLTSGAHLF